MTRRRTGIPETIPGGAERVLLHACCAPCSGAIVEYLVQQLGVRPVIFFSNANIDPREEYAHRLQECRRYADKWGLELVEDTYDHDAWQEAIRGLEHEPERGSRCAACFRFRLLHAARYAAANGFPVLTTTLASSRWKSLEQVNAAGEWACAQVEGVFWWPRNWRSGGLQERRGQIIKQEQFYNQLYCGCEFSRG